jgi:hypothetical protein
MFDVQKFGFHDAHQKMVNMLQRIDHFADTDMFRGLMDWQEQDMNRQYPNVDAPVHGQVSTRIWPTSRLRLKQVKVNVRSRRRTVKRLKPILRPELKEILKERMADLMQEKMTWRG